MKTLGKILTTAGMLSCLSTVYQAGRLSGALEMAKETGSSPNVFLDQKSERLNQYRLQLAQDLCFGGAGIVAGLTFIMDSRKEPISKRPEMVP